MIVNTNSGGLQAGVAVGSDNFAIAEQVRLQCRLGLPESCTDSEEFAALLKKAREMLQNENINLDDAKEADQTLTKIESEVSKIDPNARKVSAWFKVLESISTTASYVLASAKIVKSIVG